MEKAAEHTHVAEFVSVVKQIGGPIEFDAEFDSTTSSGARELLLDK